MARKAKVKSVSKKVDSKFKKVFVAIRNIEKLDKKAGEEIIEQISRDTYLCKKLV